MGKEEKMKKNHWNLIYITVVLFLCLLPFLFIGVAGKEQSGESKRMMRMPKIYEKGTWKKDYFKNMGSWFEENFAFRQEMVSANARILSDIFGVSATEKVVTGTDGWLYYSSTLNDYKGEKVLSDRGIFNIARTVALMQKRVEQDGKHFVFTVPPNKNTLYDKNMPYYEKKTGISSNLKKLTKELKSQKVNYVDLYKLFHSQKEVLYLKRDSHWNNKGAVLAYNAIMDAAKWPHNRYKNVKVKVRKDNIGDLARMLYPKMVKPEKNQYYPQIFPYHYIGKGQDVEDSDISTISENGSGSLLMYRDSFGNTLLPFMAGEFSKAKFSKLVPYYLDQEIEECDPDVVVVEKVERHLNTMGMQPPMMESLKVKTGNHVIKKQSFTTFREGKIGNMYMAMGQLDTRYTRKDTRIYLKITGKNKKSKTYEAFPVSMQNKKKSTDYGYQLYLNEESVPSGSVKTEILLKNGKQLLAVKTDQSVWKK